jgi:hypothetical protein
MAKTKLNFGIILKHLDLKNLELYEAFRNNQEERKEFERVLSYVLPLWYSGVFGGEDQFNLMMKFNRQVNIDWWSLDGHPELRAKVLGAIGLGHVVKHDFHYHEPQRKENALMALLMECYPDIRKDEVQLWCSVNSEAVLFELCSNYGVQEKEKEQIIDQYRKAVT